MKKIIPILFLLLVGPAVVSRAFAQPIATPTSTPAMKCCIFSTPWTPPVVPYAYGVAVDTTRARVYLTDHGLNPGEGRVLAFNYDGSPATLFGAGGVVSVAGAIWVVVGHGAYD